MAPHDHDHHEHNHDKDGHNCEHHGHEEHGHDHAHHNHDGHGHTHDHPPEEKNYNHGALRWAFSKVHGEAGEWLRRHRRKILLGTGAVAIAGDYILRSSGIEISSSDYLMASGALLGLGAVLAHDASEDIIESVGRLKQSQNLSSGLVGTAVGFGHTLSEGVFSVVSSAQGYGDLAVSSVMGSNASHILLMAGGAAIIGSVGAGKAASWKFNAAAVGTATALFSAYVASGDFIPYISAGIEELTSSFGAQMASDALAPYLMMGTGLALGGTMVYKGGSFLYHRFATYKEACAIHGDACSGEHDHDHDDEHEHSHDHHSHEHTAQTLSQRISDPEVLKLGAAVITLMPSAHILGHQLLTISQDMGLSQTGVGASVAALSMAIPEAILTWKAAHKGDIDMAWGSIVGCSVATIGIVGGGIAMINGLNGAGIPENLSLATTEGKIHMAAFAGSAAALLAATHPKINKSGTLPKWLGAAFITAAIGYYATVTQPNCHWHGPRVHCLENTINAAPEIPERF